MTQWSGSAIGSDRVAKVNGRAKLTGGPSPTLLALQLLAPPPLHAKCGTLAMECPPWIAGVGDGCLPVATFAAAASPDAAKGTATPRWPRTPSVGDDVVDWACGVANDGMSTGPAPM